MSLNEIFNKIYVINLKRRNDRRILCSKKLEKLNIEYEYWPAIDGYESKYDTLCKQVLKKKDVWINSKGAIGLILTYINILENALMKKYENILIFEDDICFHKDFENQLQRAKKNIDFNICDCIWLGANQYRYDEVQKKQLSDPNCEYYDVSYKKWHYTFGTYAIAMNKNMIQRLRKSIDISEMLCPIDAHILLVLANNNFKGRIIFPFLVLPDVTDSNNMEPRDQEKFAVERMYTINDYKYISIADISCIKQMLDIKKISLRKLFSDYTSGSLYIHHDTFIGKFDNIINLDNEEKNKIKFFAKNFYEYFASERGIILTDLFGSIEEKKNFVFIVPSFNNINNYLINLDSMRKQIYCGYQSRIIYINDCSNDGTHDVLLEYIKKYKLEDWVEVINLKSQQRQGMARFIGFHKCFDDEILINLDGDDWLFDEFVLDNLNNHFSKNDILISYGCYYIYDSDKICKSMGIPYNGKLINVKQYPLNVNHTKSFRHYDWICGHLRCGYAKLFKMIELKHFLGPDGYFLKISSDVAEMYPVLEMAQYRHQCIMQPTVVYNKYNSLQFDTSYYKMYETNNIDNKIYRETVTQMIKSRPYYPKYSGPICLKSDNVSIISHDIDNFRSGSIQYLLKCIKDYDILEKTHVYIDKQDNFIHKQMQNFTCSMFFKSKPGIILIDVIDNHQGAIIQLNNISYAVIKIINFTHTTIEPGYYDIKKLLMFLENNSKILDEIKLVPLKYQ